MWADSFREISSRIGRLFQRSRFESEMAEELQLHIELQTEQFMAEGLAREEARRQALIQFGGIEQTREQCREHVGIRLMSDFLHDMRYAIRTLVRSPGFAIVAVLTLAIGIGANTAVFSVVNTLLLRPLPFGQPDRIVMLWQQNTETGFNKDQVAWGDFLDWEQQNASFESLGYVVNSQRHSRNFMLRTGDDVTRIRGRFASSTLFGVLGVRPLLGQLFDAADDEPGGPRRVILSHALWTQAFGSDGEIIGGLVDVGRGESFEVAGVMPPEFRFPQDADIWLSIGGYSEHDERSVRRMHLGMRRRDVHPLWVVGRLRDGVTVDQADADLNAIQRQISETPANRNMVRLASEVITTPLLDQVNGQETRPALLLLMGAVAFVLLIGCANVANLLLARAMARRREIAIRVSLGAGRMRVIRQLLTESLLLSLLGAGLGVGIAVLGIDLLELIHTQSQYLGVKEFRFERLQSVGIDPAVLGFTVVVSIATGFVFGLIPAVQASRLDINRTLKEDSRSGTPGRATRLLRNSLLISEVALALVLLVCAGVALQGFVRVLKTDVGMLTNNVLRAELDLDMASQVYGTNPEDSFDEVIRRLKSVPGVTVASGCGETPLTTSGWNETFRIVDGQHDSVDQAELPAADVRLMGADAFATMGVPILEGREFTVNDNASAPRVATINQEMKERFFAEESPIGKLIQMRGWKSTERTIVGVVGSVQNYGKTKVRPEVYFPFRQQSFTGSEVGPVMLMRVSGSPVDVVPAIRSAVNGSDPREQVLIRFTGLDEVLDMSASAERFRTVLLACFAGTALLLAVVGVFGVMSYSTSQRVQEIGIRLALGAQPTDILKTVSLHGVLLCLAGIVIGAAVAVAVSRLLSSLFFGLESLDAVTLAAAGGLLLAVGTMASLLPAWKAMRVDPCVALRQE